MTTNEKSQNPTCPLCQGDHDAGMTCVQAARSKAEPSPSTLVAQAESLFESYLAARLVRARRNLTAAKVALLRDPRNREKRETLLRAESETRRLEAQLLDQVRRTSKTRERTSDMPPGRTESSAGARPTEDFRKLQAAKADLVLSTPPRDCPRCGKRVAADAGVCECGQPLIQAGSKAEALLGGESTAPRNPKSVD